MILSPEFLLTSLVVVLIPGTGVIYTVSTGLFAGPRAAVFAAMGCTAGILPHLAACILGLSAILHTSALVFQVFKFAGAAYLIYLAWAMWKDTGGLVLTSAENHRPPITAIIVRGILLNILNPKLTLFFLAFMPLFIHDASEPPIFQLLYLSAVFMGMTFFVFVLYGLLAGSISAHTARSPKFIFRLQRTFAALFALLAIKLAAAEN